MKGFIAVAVFALGVANAQEQDLTPKTNLTPRMYQELRGSNPTSMQLFDRVMEALQNINQRMDSVQVQQAGQSERQRVLIEQLQTLPDTAKLVAANTERLNILERRFDHFEATSAGNPRDLGILETKVDAIAKLVTWGVAGVASLLVATLGFLLKRVFAKLK